jgi:hypothetical protein
MLLSFVPPYAVPVPLRTTPTGPPKSEAASKGRPSFCFVFTVISNTIGILLALEIGILPCQVPIGYLHLLFNEHPRADWLGSSESESDVMEALDVGARGYI